MGHTLAGRRLNPDSLKPVGRFTLLAAASFFLLMTISYVGFYPPLFRAGGNFLFHSMGSGRVAKFESFDDPQGVFDTKMFVGSDILGVAAYPYGLGVNSVRQGYAPSAVFIALVLATPVVWRRRWRVLLAGLVLVQGFVFLRVAVALLNGFSRVGLGERRLLEVSDLSAWALRRGDQIFAGDLHMTYIVPLMVWALVLGGRELRVIWVSGDPAAEEQPRRNARCPCGSGSKYKHCCGKHCS